MRACNQNACEVAEGYMIKEDDLTFKLGQPVSSAVNQLKTVKHGSPSCKEVDPSNQPSPNLWQARPVKPGWPRYKPG